MKSSCVIYPKLCIITIISLVSTNKTQKELNLGEEIEKILKGEKIKKKNQRMEGKQIRS
jgi:hypothetical protein